MASENDKGTGVSIDNTCQRQDDKPFLVSSHPDLGAIVLSDPLRLPILLCAEPQCCLFGQSCSSALDRCSTPWTPPVEACACSYFCSSCSSTTAPVHSSPPVRQSSLISILQLLGASAVRPYMLLVPPRPSVQNLCLVSLLLVARLRHAVLHLAVQSLHCVIRSKSGRHAASVHTLIHHQQVSC